ncbi:MAG: rRNA maturation RNase YbeY [Terriglobia bacterium]
MRRKNRVPGVRGVVLVNLQKRYVVRTVSLLGLMRHLKRCLRLGNQELNICFVDDNAIRHLNSAYRGKDKVTDVLSFPWNKAKSPLRLEPQAPSRRRERGGITNFLGEVVISVEAARRNAREEGHSTLNEIRWLILHGVLHLLGYDHERDSGEMFSLELALREQLGVAGGRQAKEQVKSQKSKVKMQKFNRSRF